MVLRWLVAFFKYQSLFPKDQEEYWSLWCDGDSGCPEISCLAAHFFPMATTYLCAAADTDLGALEVLFEEELLPERIVGDRDFMERFGSLVPGLFAKALEISEIEVLAFEDQPTSCEGFRAAGLGDVETLREYERLFFREMGEEVWTSLESLVSASLVYVFEAEGRLKGFIRSNLSDGKYVHAGGLYVHPLYRGKGVARALACGLGREVRARTGATVLLDANKSNEKALRAYRAAGYRKVAEGLELTFDESAWGA